MAHSRTKILLSILTITTVVFVSGCLSPKENPDGNSDEILIFVNANVGLNQPWGIAFDSQGNLFIADRINNKIRKVDSQGVTTDFAGSGIQGSRDGIGLDSEFSMPKAIAIDVNDNIYVGEYTHSIGDMSVIRKITPSGVVTTVASYSSNYYITGLVLDSSGNIFVSNISSIRKILPDGTVSIFAGIDSQQGDITGAGTSARFYQLLNMTIDDEDNIWVTEATPTGQNLKKITPLSDVSKINMNNVYYAGIGLAYYNGKIYITGSYGGYENGFDLVLFDIDNSQMSLAYENISTDSTHGIAIHPDRGLFYNSDSYTIKQIPWSTIP